MNKWRREQEQNEYLKRDFSSFFKENYTRLYFYALRFIPDSEICKDIVSDSFHFMWENIDSVKMNTALTYLYTHIRFRCIDHIRQTKMKNMNIPSYIAMLEEWQIADWNESEERIQTIMQLIAKMPPPTQKIMEECYLNNKKYREVAQMMGISESGVRKHIIKGLSIIREYFSVKYKKGITKSIANS